MNGVQSWLQGYVCRELGQDYGQYLLRDQADTIRLYDFYEGRGQDWDIAAGLDYKPNKTLVNHTKKLIHKVAGFMFGRAPEITLTPAGDDEHNAARVAELEQHLREVLEGNGWKKRLLKAGRDCAIGKRVALKIGLGAEGALRIRFRPSVEFFHDVTCDDDEKLSRIIFAYGMNDAKEPDAQRIWVQSYRMEGGKCLWSEGIYNGYGTLMEDRGQEQDSGLAGLPAYVILNDGTTSDVLGESDVCKLRALQTDYNHLMSDDQDALKFNMFPQTVFTDAAEDCMKSVKISPGAMVDLQTDSSKVDAQAKVDKLESKFAYNDRFQNALDTVLKDMYALMCCPQVTVEYLKAAGISGKAMKALYWDLTCLCEERWAEWDTALEWMVREIVRQEKLYKLGDWTGCKFTIHIEHLYPIADDEDEERQLDMQEVGMQVRSRASYLDKWQPSADAEEELERIAKEKQLLEESYMADASWKEEKKNEA